MIRSRNVVFHAIILALVLASCTPSPAPTPPTATATREVLSTPTPTVVVGHPGQLLFSEFTPGVPGNNNFEFIELYNAGREVVDLRGWSIWYQMTETQDPRRVYRWSRETHIPGYGHYLLVREGEDIGMLPDATYDVPLFERWGGLVLRNADGEDVDAMAWGKAPIGFVDEAPAPAPVEGGSLERLPGGVGGHLLDTDDGAEDFVIRPVPFPQNSGSEMTPMPEHALQISASTALTVTPGTRFPLEILVENRTAQDLTDVRVVVPLPEGTDLASLMVDGVDVSESEMQLPADAPGVPEGAVAWEIPTLPDGANSRAELTMRSPWRYGEVVLKGYYVAAPDWPLRDYGAFAELSVAGGAIPIEVARTLEGSVVTIEGIATMYTGGFFAGSTGTKFYLQDETGGIQVYCPNGHGIVTVRIGDRVRVTGEVDVYRDSVEIVPATYPDDVRILDRDNAPPQPQMISASEATGDEGILGELIRVEGTITRLEEFEYSYEIDLLGDGGDAVLVYVDKDSRINPEFLDTEQRYRITGISELYDGKWQLKPRTSEDFERIYPPELMLDVTAQNNVGLSGLLTTTLTVHNYTEGTLRGVRVSAQPSSRYVDVVASMEAARPEGDQELLWDVGELSPLGGTAVVTFVAQLKPGVSEGNFTTYATATADQWPNPVTAESAPTFVGTGVPIWAIQGEGGRSPFVRSALRTEGVVTGAFPEHEGFWMQSLESDDDSSTSEGLFVWTSNLVLSPTVAIGDFVNVSGVVRERSGQTLLAVQQTEGVLVQGHDYALPAPVELDPPRDETEAGAYYEAIEGMLVQVSDPVVAVAPTSQYGETALVRPSWDIERVRKGEPAGMLIFADDGSSQEHVTQATLPYVLKSGDRIDDLLGPLAFTYENFKIQPIVTPTVLSDALTLPAFAPVGPNDFSVATFNVENFFDPLLPHPSSPERPDPATYRLRVAKAAATIKAMAAPTILGLQEVENIGILEDIVEAPELSAYGYVPALVEGFDSRGIDVGYLVRGDVATLEGVGQYDAPDGLTSRPPLMITVTLRLAGVERRIHVLNNHFTSMSGGELATEPRRTAQAAWNAALVGELLARSPDAQVVVLGDLNSFYDSPPIDTLREAGLRHVYESVDPPLPYTYIFQGVSETLDHILITPSLYEDLVAVEALHINADYPPPAPDDASPQRLSDHDPLIAVFTLD
ncbi:MAG: endonuclease/exonuclease/phosphatase family protein [Anaerolineae bacterium]